MFSLVKEQLKDKEVCDFVSYLSSEKNGKDNNIRCLAWLFGFGIIQTNNWDEELEMKINDYVRWKNHYCDKKSLKELEKGLDEVIPKDLARSSCLCQNILGSLNINQFFMPTPISFYQILTVISQEVPNFYYYQGSDRFLYYSTAVAVQFSTHFNLNCSICEALVFYLFRSFVTEISLAKEILDEASNAFFIKINRFLNATSPVTFSAYVSQNLSSEQYAPNLLLPLFSDQHPPEETLFIWDNIIAHKSTCQSYIFAVLVAHLNQSQFGTNAVETTNRIIKNDSWRMDKLMSDTLYFSQKVQKNVKKNQQCIPLYLWILPIILVILLFIVIFKH